MESCCICSVPFGTQYTDKFIDLWAYRLKVNASLKHDVVHANISKDTDFLIHANF